MMNLMSSKENSGNVEQKMIGLLGRVEAVEKEIAVIK